MHPYKRLSEDEEIKINRLPILLSFLSLKEIVYFFATGPFRFDSRTECFSDSITDRVISPSQNMINLFYLHLYSAAIEKLKIEIRKSKIKGLGKLLIRFNRLDFLPIAI